MNHSDGNVHGRQCSDECLGVPEVPARREARYNGHALGYIGLAAQKNFNAIYLMYPLLTGAPCTRTA